MRQTDPFLEAGIQQLGVHNVVSKNTGMTYPALRFRRNDSLVHVDLQFVCASRDPIGFCIQEVLSATGDDQ